VALGSLNSWRSPGQARKPAPMVVALAVREARVTNRPETSPLAPSGAPGAALTWMDAAPYDYLLEIVRRVHAGKRRWRIERRTAHATSAVPTIRAGRCRAHVRPSHVSKAAIAAARNKLSNDGLRTLSGHRN
jgi:hypothetical protein